jgi:hypothetical protein
MKLKICNSCGITKEETKDNFVNGIVRGKLHFHTICKPCSNLKARLKRKVLGKKKITNDEINKTKKCPRCETWLSYEDFYKNKGGYLGLGAHCKKCHSENNKASEALRRAKNKGNKISSKEYLTILKNHNYKCRYCERNVEIGVNMHWDHFIPIKLGGENTIEMLFQLA